VTKADRRIQRTRQSLQRALIDLIGESRFEAITIQQIVDRADVGRTTFYLHYRSKDDLFVSCHEAIASQFHPWAQEHLLAPEPPPEIASGYRHLQEAWPRLSPVFQGRDGLLILRRIRDRSARRIETGLRSAFPDTDCSLPLDLLAVYLAGAQTALLQWWLEKRRPHRPEDVARTFHRLQRTAIRDAFGLTVGE